MMHRTLDRREQFDERSRSFDAGALLDTSEPRSYTWGCPAWLDQGREGACFPAGTAVRMADGSQRRIDEVRLLDEVVTAEGRTGVVTELMARRATRGLVKVSISGHVPLRCTPEHPVLTARGYVPAEHLRTDDEVAITRYLPDAGTVLDPRGLVDTREMRGVLAGQVNTGGVITEVTALPPLLACTPALGRLIGLYAAEGSTTANKVVWSFGGHETETLVHETASLIKSVFDAVPRTQHRPNGSVNVVLYGKTWRHLFELLVPGTSKHGDKHLSPHVTQRSPEYLDALLHGWLDGDGHHRRTEVVGISVCRRLALDMHAIATGLGYRPRAAVSHPSANQHAATRQMRYEVGIGLAGGGARSARIDHGAHWRQVRAVEPEAFEGYVFNMEVEGDHSYVADGVGVHNCVGFAWAHEHAARPHVRPADTALAQALYREAQRLDPWPGEDYSGTSVLAGAKAAQARGHLTSYRWAFTLADALAVVSRHGPAVAGVNWWTGMFTPDAEGFIRPTGQVAGGHAILVRGVNVRRRTVTLRNSWGRSWGRDGDCYLTWDDFGTLLADGGELCVPVRRGP